MRAVLLQRRGELLIGVIQLLHLLVRLAQQRRIMRESVRVPDFGQFPVGSFHFVQAGSRGQVEEPKPFLRVIRHHQFSAKPSRAGEAKTRAPGLRAAALSFLRVVFVPEFRRRHAAEQAENFEFLRSLPKLERVGFWETQSLRSSRRITLRDWLGRRGHLAPDS
jgi:hypothetical protein